MDYKGPSALARGMAGRFPADPVREGAMDFLLLGPMIIRRSEEVVTVPVGKQRAVLATLLLNTNIVVPVDELVEALWGNNPPRAARETLQNYVKRLRHVLGDRSHTRISTHQPGYSINVAPGELDLDRFEELVTRAQLAASSGAWHKAAASLQAALTLWRGQPLADVQSDYLTSTWGPRLREMHQRALEDHIDAEFHLSRHREVLSQLWQLASANPLRERPQAMLMVALYRDGRQAEALSVYHQARQRLIEELGIEPGPILQRTHQGILVGDEQILQTLTES